MSHTFVVGIAGGSGSGKTTFAKKILKRVKQKHESLGAHLAILHMDAYYLESMPQSIRMYGQPNFDHPEAFDWNLLKTHLQMIREGKKINSPIYDYHNSCRSLETLEVGPCQALLFEGIYALWNPELRNLLDLRIYLHIDADIRFIRRLHRDVKERGRTLDGIIRQYYDTVRPMHREFLEQTSQYADLVVGEESDVAADVVSARVLQILKKEDC